MRNLMLVAGVLTLLLTACAPAQVPTVDPAQVQASAVAAAGTIIASTQAAIPTATPVPPPTETPLPSPTSIFLATLDPLAGFSTGLAPTATPQGSQGDCAHLLDVGQAGKTHQTLIKNETTGTVNLSLSLYKVNAFGQCGYISYGNLHKNSSVMADLPPGYWSAYAWATTKGKNFTAGGSFYVQPAQFDKLELCIRDEKVIYSPQC